MATPIVSITGLLKARLAALNCDLLEDETEGADRFFIFDKTAGKLVVLAQPPDQIEAWCESHEEERAPEGAAVADVDALRTVARRFEEIKSEVQSWPLSKAIGYLNGTSWQVLKVHGRADQTDDAHLYLMSQTVGRRAIRFWVAAEQLLSLLASANDEATDRDVAEHEAAKRGAGAAA